MALLYAPGCNPALHSEVIMKRSACSSLAVVLLLVSASGCGGGDASSDAGPPDTTENFDTGADSTPPTAGSTLTASNPTSSTVDLTWSAGTDDTTSAANLEYRVYFSTADDLDTVTNVLANGTAGGDWQAALTLTVEGLSLDTAYFFNVLVRDEAGNVSVYGGASETTLGGTWQEEEPLEDYTGGSAYYSTVTVSPTGDIAHYWTQQPTWETHFAIRSGATGTLGGATAWSAAGIRTSALVYGFDGRLAGASVRDNGDDTADVLFAAHTPGTANTFDTVATGLVAEFAWKALACVAENGDVMVAWMEGTANSALTVRARFRTGGTWGTATRVSPADDLDLNNLEVVCSPDGDHVVLYAENTGVTTELNARVYDASAGDWAAPAAPVGEGGYQYQMASARTVAGRVVVAFEETDETLMGTVIRARTYEGGAWSASIDTLADNAPVNVSNVSLTAAGNDVHAVWIGGGQFFTRRLPGGSSTWSAETPLDMAAPIQEYCLAGDPTGGALLAWASNDDLFTQAYSTGANAWGTSSPIENVGQFGYGSLACVLTPQRQAAVVYTVWDATAMSFSAFVRAFR